MRGFALVELTSVILILAILSADARPRFSASRTRRTKWWWSETETSRHSLSITPSMTLNGKENLPERGIWLYNAWAEYFGSTQHIRHRPRAAQQLQGGFVDKRKTWREQEQQLVARWNDAAERQRQLHEELSRQPDEGASELKQKELAVRSEIEGLRREVARLKVQFNSGKRY